MLEIMLTLGSFLTLCVVIALTSVRPVKEGEQIIILRFGRYKNTLKPGLHFIIPFIDTVGARVKMMEQTVRVENIDCITQDNASISLNVIVFTQIFDAHRSVFAVSGLHDHAIEAMVSTAIRAAVATFDIDHLLTKREDVNLKIAPLIEESSERWGVKLRTEILDINLPADLKASMNTMLKADRSRRAEIIQANADREGAIIRSEGQRESDVNISQGQLEAANNRALAREREALAESEAIRVITRAIDESNQSQVSLSYVLGLKYTEALKEIGSSESSRLVMVPFEAASLIGSIAGISELFTGDKESKLPSPLSIPPKKPAITESNFKEDKGNS